MVHAWVEHIRQYAKEHNLTYPNAMKDPNCKATYKSKKGSAMSNGTKVEGGMLSGVKKRFDQHVTQTYPTKDELKQIVLNLTDRDESLFTQWYNKLEEQEKKVRFLRDIFKHLKKHIEGMNSNITGNLLNYSDIWRKINDALVGFGENSVPFPKLSQRQREIQIKEQNERSKKPRKVSDAVTKLEERLKNQREEDMKVIEVAKQNGIVIFNEKKGEQKSMQELITELESMNLNRYGELLTSGDRIRDEDDDNPDARAEGKDTTEGKGLSKRPRRFAKGSKEAKDYMAALRARRKKNS